LEDIDIDIPLHVALVILAVEHYSQAILMPHVHRDTDPTAARDTLVVDNTAQLVDYQAKA
jgi:hypothetical protein